MSDEKIRSYVASKASVPGRVKMWQDARDGGAVITSSWIDEAGAGETKDYTEFWDRVTEEIRGSDRVVFYAETDDVRRLRGSLVEAGIGMAFGKELVFVLPGVFTHGPRFKPLGSWARYRNAYLADSVADALALPVGQLKPMAVPS